MPFGLGVFEILLIVVLLMLFFGASRIPLIARGLGAGIRNFKGEMRSGDRDRDELGDDRGDRELRSGRDEEPR